MNEPNQEQPSAEQQEGADASPERSRDEVMEALNALPLTPDTKVDLALVYLKEKPATQWAYTVSSRQPGWEQRNYGRESFDLVAQWAALSGMSTQTRAETVNPQQEAFRGVEGQRLREELDNKNQLDEAEALAVNPEYSADRLQLFVGKDDVWLQKMIAAYDQWDPQLFGECVGFPPSAVEAYVNQTCVSPRAADTEHDPEISAFAQYMVSPGDTGQELATAKRWAAAIHEANPELYNQMIDTHRKETT
jgi:hypothetical protein